MKILPLKQRDGSACGPTSIKMAADYLKVPLSYAQIAQVSGYKKKGGLSNRDLVQALKKLNFDVREHSNATWNDLIRQNGSEHVIIVSWMLSGYIGHFSVVEKVDKTHIYLADPEKGKIVKMPKIEFLRLWMDYDDVWFPQTVQDIQLRWMCVVKIPL